MSMPALQGRRATYPRRQTSDAGRNPAGAERRTSVLVVEDDPSGRVLMTQVLERAGYHVVAVADGEAALRAVAAGQPDLVLLDVGLPGMDGLEVCARLRAEPRHATLPIIMLTARTQLQDIVTGLGAGADDYLAKPFRQPELLARIRSAVRLRQAMVRMETAHAVVATLANAVEAKDPMTEHHCQRLASLSARLTSRLGVDHHEAESIAYGALLHDVGKIGIPEAILTKATPLTEDEWVLMRRHPEIGERICRPLEASANFLPIIRHHHERWDGNGYPDRLAGERIPFGARVVSLADAFDAMTHARHYRPARSVDDALQEIRAGAGTQFDPVLARHFIEAIELGGPGSSDAEAPTFPVPLPNV